MRFDNEFAAIEEGAVEVENNELHWNDSDGWITEQNPRLLVFREVITSNIIRLSTNVGIGSKAPALTVGRSLSRDASYLAPPAQIRTGPIRAYGSHLGCLTAKRLSGHG
jgi:hypothetical protein